MRINKLYINILCAAVASLPLLASCQKEDILLPRGDRRDPASMEAPVGVRIYSSDAEGELVPVTLDVGEGQSVFGVYASITRPSELNQKVLLEVGSAEEALEYASMKNIRCVALPESHLSFPEGKSMLVPAGKTLGMVKPVQVLGTDAAGNVLAPGRYLLPLRLISEQETNTLYLDVNVRKPFVSEYPLYQGEDMFMVFYLITAQFDP